MKVILHGCLTGAVLGDITARVGGAREDPWSGLWLLIVATVYVVATAAQYIQGARQ